MAEKHREEFEGKIKIRIGGNRETDKLVLLIKDKKLEGIIEYIGWVDEDKKPVLFFTSDIYIQPSYWEALGIAILEAMSYGLPVVASNTGGIPEIVKDGQNGLLVIPGDIDGLFETIMKLADSKELRREMGIRGASITKDFYLDSVKQQLLEVYSNLI